MNEDLEDEEFDACYAYIRHNIALDDIYDFSADMFVAASRLLYELTQVVDVESIMKEDEILCDYIESVIITTKLIAESLEKGKK